MEIITAEDVQAIAPGGELMVSVGAVITPWAREVAATRRVRITQGGVAAAPETIAIGSDHGGFALKEDLKAVLTRLGARFRDFGAFSAEPVDYPDVALAVARAVRAGEARLGILIDGAGLGSAMAANKVPGVRAAPCTDVVAARTAREHNDANVLTLGARLVDAQRLPEIVEVFLSASCTEERHARRVKKISAIEDAYRR